MSVRSMPQICTRVDSCDAMNEKDSTGEMRVASDCLYVDDMTRLLL